MGGINAEYMGFGPASGGLAPGPRPGVFEQAGTDEEVRALRKQLDNCKDWIKKMRESADVEMPRLRNKELLLAKSEIECEGLRSRVNDLQVDNVRLDRERRRLMELNNDMKAQLHRVGDGGIQLLDHMVPEQPDNRTNAELRCAEEHLEESARRVQTLEAALQRMTVQ